MANTTSMGGVSGNGGAGGGAGAGGPVFEPPSSTRVSVQSIMSLVLSLLCCVPGPSVIATLLGVSALVSISRRPDRLSGRGLALAGIIVSMGVSMVWLGVAIGTSSAVHRLDTSVLRPTSTLLTAIDKGDYATARTVMSAKAGAAVSDAQFAAFHDAVHAEAGGFAHVPDHLVELLGTASDAMSGLQSPALHSVPSSNDIVPVFATYDQEPALVVLSTTQPDAFKLALSGSLNSINGLVTNVVFVSKSNKVIWLVPPATGNPAPAGPKTPGTPAAPPGAPGTPAAPTSGKP